MVLSDLGRTVFVQSLVPVELINSQLYIFNDNSSTVQIIKVAKRYKSKITNLKHRFKELHKNLIEINRIKGNIWQNKSVKILVNTKIYMVSSSFLIQQNSVWEIIKDGLARKYTIEKIIYSNLIQ